METYNKAQLSILTATIIWGFTPVVVEGILDYLSPLHIMTIRFGIAVIVAAIIFPFFKGREVFSLVFSKTCMKIGWLYALGYLTATIGQKITTAGLATLLSTSFVFIVPFIAWKFEGTGLNRKIFLISGIAFTGVLLISFNGDWNNFLNVSGLGILLLLVAALAWGFYMVISDKFLTLSKVDGQTTSVSGFIFAILLHTFLPLFFLSAITGELPFTFTQTVLPLLLFLGIFPTIGAFCLASWTMTKIGSVNTSFYILLQIIVPFVYEMVFLKYSYSLWIYSGIVLVLFSIFWISGVQTSTLQKKDVKEGFGSSIQVNSVNSPITTTIGLYLVFYEYLKDAKQIVSQHNQK
ncbi:MAG: DMT family transporter [Candidatus Hodarchaeales archaeon]|jgi:drug/metabolite transporter (DMT)-like permease